jgi:hypothetical protein
MKFDIDDSRIEQSFDAIAKELINEHVIQVNDREFQFTEIEFYYFKTGVHEDNYTHKHRRDPGEWRIHNQGLDITLKGDEVQDGGILIRGLKYFENTSNGNKKVHYINGPIKSLSLLFEAMGSAMNPSSIVLLRKQTGPKVIHKTFRHIFNKTENADFRFKDYRYLSDFENLSISEQLKVTIRNNPKVL